MSLGSMHERAKRITPGGAPLTQHPTPSATTQATTLTLAALHTSPFTRTLFQLPRNVRAF